MKPKEIKWIIKPGFSILNCKREIKPIGKLIILGKELTVEQTTNYFKTLNNL